MFVSTMMSRNAGQGRVEVGLYATVAVSSSLMVVCDELFWAGFCAGLLSNMVCVRLMLLRAQRFAQPEEE